MSSGPAGKPDSDACVENQRARGRIEAEGPKLDARNALVAHVLHGRDTRRQFGIEGARAVPRGVALVDLDGNDRSIGAGAVFHARNRRDAPARGALGREGFDFKRQLDALGHGKQGLADREQRPAGGARLTVAVDFDPAVLRAVESAELVDDIGLGNGAHEAHAVRVAGDEHHLGDRITGFNGLLPFDRP